MATKLRLYAESILEATWLAAAISVPLFFNVYSSNVFEPDKVALLRTLALVSLAAWTIKLIEQRAFQVSWLKEGKRWFKSIYRIPLVLPVAALVGTYLISTLFSIDPRVSLFGSHQRMQGAYTTFSYLVIFASIVGNLRRRGQLRRLLTAIILTSIPVSIYGILQHYQMDPISWGGDTISRITSNLGNAIFLGAYLIMIFPLTVYRIAESFDSILNDRGRLAVNFLRSSMYIFIGMLQLVALFFTGSRGPWLGWIAGGIFALLLLALVWRKRWIGFCLMTLVVSGTAFLVLLNLPSGPLGDLRSVPEFKRASRLLDIESPTGQVRVLIWKGVAELVAPHQPLLYPDGRQDAFNPIRPLIGYGPESMYFAYPPFYPPELAHAENRDTWPDRAHNETWDTLVRSGLLGLAVYMALFGSLFYYGLKWLGFIPGFQERNWFWLLILGGGAAGAGVTSLVFGPGFLGVGLPFGLLAGMLLYSIWFASFNKSGHHPTKPDGMQSVLLVALLAALIGHFVEINFGIPVSVTRIYFWVEAGLLLVVGHFRINGGLEPAAIPTRQAQDQAILTDTGNKKQTEPGNAGSRTAKNLPGGRNRPWLRECLISSFMAALILVPLGFGFLAGQTSTGSTFSLLWRSVTSLPTSIDGGVSYGVLVMVFITLLSSVILLSSEIVHSSRGLPWRTVFGPIAGGAVLLGSIFWLWHAHALTGIAPFPPGDFAGASALLSRTEGLLENFYAYELLLVAGLALSLTNRLSSQGPRFNWFGAAALPILLISVLSIARDTNLQVVQADMAANLAGASFARQSYPAAIWLYQRAASLAPAEADYNLYIGKTYVEYAKSEKDPRTREQLVERAEDALLKAQLLSPLNPDHTANLARLYNYWSTLAEHPAERMARGETASAYYAQATAISPNDAVLWGEWGKLALEVLNRPSEAFDRFSRALSIDPIDRCAGCRAGGAESPRSAP